MHRVNTAKAIVKGSQSPTVLESSGGIDLEPIEVQQQDFTFFFSETVSCTHFSVIIIEFNSCKYFSTPLPVIERAISSYFTLVQKILTQFIHSAHNLILNVLSSYSPFTSNKLAD